MEAKHSHVVTFKTKFNIPDLLAPITFLRDLVQWVKFIKEKKVDVIHVNEHEIYPSIRYAAFISRTPVVAGIRFRINEKFAHWLFGGICKIDRALFTSQDQYKHCIEGFPAYLKGSRSTVIGNGRNYKKMIASIRSDNSAKFIGKLNISSNPLLIGTASSIRPRKRLEDFINIIEALIKNGNNVIGLIAGGGKYADSDYENMLKVDIINKQLTKSCLMLGNLDDLSPFYSNLDFFVSTSELETFGMSVSEAMAFGVPSIGYEGGSVQEVIGNKDFIVTNGKWNEIVAIIENLIKQPDKYSAASKQQKERILNNFDAPALAAKVEAIYEDIFPNG
ncbi:MULTISPECIES: glycosyltransferase family 4 protein [unclassified Alteromonas]|uniref:glycosyltransferase family 4 protein n=1 Tax=unclassified Alteromonas TaxID=2614992 RepID=UPI00050A16C9|nr:MULTISPECIES: glycosyltransferase family 4 protein [unclassified Alteromonas]